MNKETNKKFALWAAIGLAVGYLSGILNAPKSGQETRQDIKNNGVKKLIETEKLLKSLYKDLSQTIEQAALRTKTLQGQAKAKLVELIDEAKLAQAKVKDILSAVRHGDAEDPDLQAAIKQAAAAQEHLVNFLKKP